MIIDFNKIVSAEGRNGFMRQTGIEIIHVEDCPIGQFTSVPRVQLFPINTRGAGRGMMEIPTDNLKEFIEALIPPANMDLPDNMLLGAETVDEFTNVNFCIIHLSTDVKNEITKAKSLAELLDIEIQIGYVHASFFEHDDEDLTYSEDLWDKLTLTTESTHIIVRKDHFTVIGYNEIGSEYFADFYYSTLNNQQP